MKYHIGDIIKYDYNNQHDLMILERNPATSQYSVQYLNRGDKNIFITKEDFLDQCLSSPSTTLVKGIGIKMRRVLDEI